jgi:hypothetical protein
MRYLNEPEFTLKNLIDLYQQAEQSGKARENHFSTSRKNRASLHYFSRVIGRL